MSILAAKLTPNPLSDKNFQELKETIVSRVPSVCSPVRIYLFGGAATNTMSQASDIDIDKVLPVVCEVKLEDERTCLGFLYRKTFEINKSYESHSQ